MALEVASGQQWRAVDNDEGKNITEA